MIKNGKPYTNENGYIDDELISDVPEKVQKIVMDWIANNIRPRKMPLFGHTSYGLKHYLDHDTGVYLTNNQFKDAMMQAGYEPINPNALNWEYCISRKSPVFCNKQNTVTKAKSFYSGKKIGDYHAGKNRGKA